MCPPLRDCTDILQRQLDVAFATARLTVTMTLQYLFDFSVTAKSPLAVAKSD
jgi:hypothetical protein